MSRNDLRSQSLDLLRFPLAVVVLTIHTFSANGLTVQGAKFTFDEVPFFLELNHFIDGFLRGQSVPIYFFISGYVFFLGVKLTKEKYAQKLRNRVKTLLIPYLIWNTIAVLYSLTRIVPCLSFLFPNGSKWHLDISLPRVLAAFWDNSNGILVQPTASVEAPASLATYPADVPLWFVRDLMIVVLCAPLLYWLLNRTRYYAVLILGVLWFALGYLELGHAYQLLTAFFFFSWGAYMSVNAKDMMHEFNRFFKPSIVLYPLLALLYVLSVHCFPSLSDTIKRVNVFVGLFFAYNLSSWLLTHKVCKVSPFLASSSFFIYVAHGIFSGDWLKLFFVIFHPAGELGFLSIYILAVVANVGLLLLAFYLLRRFAPGLLKVVAGRK